MKRKQKAQDELPPIKEALLADQHYRSFRRIVKTIESTLDLDKYYEECVGLHDSRLSRTLVNKTVATDALSQAVRQDASFRARYTKIQVALTKQSGALEEAIKVTRRHLMSRYRSYTDHLGTKAERIDYMDRYLTRGKNLLSRMKTTIECISLLVKDVDALHWQMKIAYDCMELTYGKNSQTGV